MLGKVRRRPRSRYTTGLLLGLMIVLAAAEAPVQVQTLRFVVA